MEELKFDYSKVRGKIKEVFGTQDKFAENVNMGRVAVSQRLNNSIDLSDKEIFKWSRTLGIEAKDIPIYFFTLVVQKNEPESTITT